MNIFIKQQLINKNYISYNIRGYSMGKNEEKSTFISLIR